MGQNHSVGSTSRGEIVISGPSPFDILPEDCISYIISLTCPRDACVAATVSKTLKSAADSDSVWEKFLSPEFTSVIPPQSRVGVFASTKELYFALCDDHVLIDNGKKSLCFDKEGAKKCIMVSSKEARITWGSSPQYWQWISLPESRFEKIAELLNVRWFEIRVRMHTRYLSPRTRYSVYIVFKTKDGCPGLGDLPVEVGVGLVGQESSQRFIYFVGPKNQRREREMRDVIKPKQRRDGWMEAELGEFYNEECCDNTTASVLETKSTHLKRGLIIQGFEFRPTKTT